MLFLSQKVISFDEDFSEKLRTNLGILSEGNFTAGIFNPSPLNKCYGWYHRVTSPDILVRGVHTGLLVDGVTSPLCRGVCKSVSLKVGGG